VAKESALTGEARSCERISLVSRKLKPSFSASPRASASLPLPARPFSYQRGTPVLCLLAVPCKANLL
jgi:hypothetical protein